MALEHALFQVGIKAIIIRHEKALIVEDGMKPGQWDLPGGRIDVHEDAETALKREMKEELGFDSCTVGAVVDYSLWFRTGKPAICYVAILLQNENDDIRLSAEHTDARWVSLYEIDEHTFVFSGMKRMLRKGFEYYTLLKHGK